MPKTEAEAVVSYRPNHHRPGAKPGRSHGLIRPFAARFKMGPFPHQSFTHHRRPFGFNDNVHI
ncbi:hypothetical protein D3C71_2190890 [compost metagenome]